MQSKTPDHKNQERLTKQHYAKKKNQSSKREMKNRYVEIWKLISVPAVLAKKRRINKWLLYSEEGY